LDRNKSFDCLVEILLHLFDAMVAPILLYGAEVWGYEKNDIFETLHLEFCKYIMKVKKCTPNYIVYGNTVYIQCTVSSRVISPFSFKTKMTSHMDHFT
jgi:hypothetical protein